MRSGTVRINWSQPEDALLLRLHGEGLEWELIAMRFPRHTKAACQARRALLRSKNKDPQRVPQPQRRWSDDDNADLVRRGDAGEPFEKIGESLSRTRWACKVQYHALKRAKVERPVTKQTLREASLIKAAETRIHVAALPPRSLTAEFCGDPLPGRSALDRKRAGIIDDEPPRVDYRFTDLRPKPTLAGVA